jgi:hypothetical protein
MSYTPSVPNLVTSNNADVITGGAFGSIIGREPDEYVGFYGEYGTPQQASTTSSGSPTLDLASAATFGAGASSTITNTGSTNITGDLFLSPAGSITGSPTVSGTIHNGDTAAAAALTDANNAFIAGNALAGYTTIAAALGGTSPAPGYYTTASSFSITGTVTLNGGPNDVWVFKSPSSTLVTASSSVVLLTGGALAKNVYWLVGSSATLGTSSTFNGTIIASASITDDGGSTIHGHLFALTAAVTLNNTTIVSSGNGSGGGGGPITSVPELVTILQNLGILALATPLWFMTGTITSGTFSNGETLIQLRGGAEATLVQVSADTQTLNVSGYTGTANVNSHWVGKTSGAVFMPSTLPISTAMLVQ